jgi:uncharacterized membrane protein HdeD (DUF308 family)
VSNALGRKWWVFLLNGICAIVFGLIAFLAERITLYDLAILYGAYCLLDGVTALAAAFARDATGSSWGRMLLGGLVSMLAGITAIAWPGLTGAVLLFIIGTWAILRGGSEIVAAIDLRKIIQNEWVLLAAGVICILFGLMLIAMPENGALGLISLIGIFAMARGLLLIVLSFRLRGWENERRTDNERGTK